jgi:hypothetical protein
MRGKNGRKRTVLVKAIKQRYDDGKTAAREDTFAENPVF